MSRVEMPLSKLTADLDRIEYKNKKCYTSGCKEKPIISHTISKNYLNKLRSNLVDIKMFQPKLTPVMQKSQLIRDVDEKTFSSFPGFCERCDNDIFKDIDAFNGVINHKKATLVHYRNICYGIHHIRTQILRLSHVSVQNFVGDSANPDVIKTLEAFKSGSLLDRLIYCLNEHSNRKASLEKMLKHNNYDEIDYISLTGSLDDPIFCGRSSNLLHKDQPFYKREESQGYSIMPWMSYMTLLTANSNQLIFCWLKSDAKYSKRLKNLIKHRRHKKVIEVLAYGCSDAFAIEKKFYAKHIRTIEEIILKYRSY